MLRRDRRTDRRTPVDSEDRAYAWRLYRLWRHCCCRGITCDASRVGVVIMLYPESPTFYYRQLTLPMPYTESSTLLKPQLTLPILYIKSSTLLTVGLSIVVSCVAGLSKMIDRWKDDFTLLNPHLSTTRDKMRSGADLQALQGGSERWQFADQ